MKIVETDVTIIGAGLTGLTIAYLLREKDITVTIIEARGRLGGRVFTETNNGFTPIDMGATWFTNQHTQLLALLKKLNVETFHQIFGDKAIYEPIFSKPHQIVSLPHNSEPSYRIKGGTSHLINTLSNYINPNQIHYNEIVNNISEDNDSVIIKSDNTIFKSRIVISTLPPNLLKRSININPELPSDVVKIMENTHTWMGESIKIGLRFESPFWRKNNLSGTIFSNAGPITEFYDHSDYDNKKYALKGFMNNNYFSLKKEERLKMILNQLKKYYGKEVENYTDYQELVWRKEIFTYSNYNSDVLAHQNNGHVFYQKSFLNDKFYIVGAETADGFPGYMEGAVRSAQNIYSKIENKL